MVHAILAADDEPAIVELMKRSLESAGHRVLVAADGEEALSAFRRESPDCVLLDVDMPGLDGISAARELRKESTVPILFLTACADELDLVLGFELGGDDYVAKPFGSREIVARVGAVLGQRRRGGASQNRLAGAGLSAGGIRLDFERHECRVLERAVPLTAAQFAILATMMGEPGRVWGRSELLERASGSSWDGGERTLDAHVKNIRKALGEDLTRPRFIETVRGVGYRFKG